MWTTFFYALTATVSVLCLIGSIYAARRAVAGAESLRKRIRSCELQIELLNSSRDEMVGTVTDLANRVKMQRVRNVVNHAAGSSGEPDPFKDPDGWRNMMNRKLALSKVGLGK